MGNGAFKQEYEEFEKGASYLACFGYTYLETLEMKRKLYDIKKRITKEIKEEEKNAFYLEEFKNDQALDENEQKELEKIFETLTLEDQKEREERINGGKNGRVKKR